MPSEMINLAAPHPASERDLAPIKQEWGRARLDSAVRAAVLRSAERKSQPDAAPSSAERAALHSPHRRISKKTSRSLTINQCSGTLSCVANIDSFCRIAEALRHSMAIVLEKEFHFRQTRPEP